MAMLAKKGGMVFIRFRDKKTGDVKTRFLGRLDKTNENGIKELIRKYGGA